MAPTNIYVPGAPSIGKVRRRIGLGSAGNSTAAARKFSSFIFANFSNAATTYTAPARVRPYEPFRTQLVIQNLGSTILQLGYTPNANTGTIDATNTVWNITLNPGQEYRENGFSNRIIFLRPNTSGQAGAYSVYAELNGTAQSGTAVIQNVTAPALAVPAFKALGAGGSGVAPIGISKDRSTLYGYQTSSKTKLSKSTDGGQTYTQVISTGQLPGNIVGFKELDDGSAIIYSQLSAPTTGFISRNPNWLTTPGTGWTTVLTEATNGAVRPIWGQFSFGSDAIVAGSGKYGFVCEYGGTVTTEADPCHGYFTSDYGATWTMVFDGLTNPWTTGITGHTKGAAYDPYWDRLWITLDIASPNQIGATYAWILYSDDHGTTWTPLTLPPEWQNLSGTNFSFSSNNIGIHQDRIVFGSDHDMGQFIYPRAGYRVLSTGFIGGVWTNRANTLQTAMTQHRAALTQPTLQSVGGSTGDSTPTTLHVDGTNGGATWTQLWQGNDTSTTTLDNVYGPTTGDVVFLNQTASSFMRGQIIPGVLGQMAQRVFFTGNGVTTVFSFPHYLSTTPTALAYPNGVADAALSAPTVTTDATNITLTFAVAPAAATYQFGLRYQ